jgi:predicted TIM-barrel fold metal-dependent hydrolase
VSAIKSNGISSTSLQVLANRGKTMMKQLGRFSGHLGKALAALFVAALLPNLAAQDFVWAPDFPVGSSLPEISAPDQDGTVRSFDDLKGEKGLLFVYSRSFDW